MESKFRVILFAKETYQFLELIIINLRWRWPNLEPIIASQGETDLDSIELEEANLVILCEDIESFTTGNAIKKIREFSDIPIIVLGGHEEKREITQMIKALDAGADDYIAIPDDTAMLLPVLIARTASLMRRIYAGITGNYDEPIHIDDLIVDPNTFQAYLGGVSLHLTPTEFKLLYLLVRNRGIVIRMQILMRTLWRDSEGAEDTLKKYIQLLRSKLGDDARNPIWITTMRGVGYRFKTSERKEIASDSAS